MNPSPSPATEASGLRKHRAREVPPVAALSDADLEAIARTEMAPRHDG